MTRINVYRVYRAEDRRWWKRTWQAEWEGCMWCPRAYTQPGVHRKAMRWMAWSPWRQRTYVRWRRLVRLAVHS